MDKYLPEPLIDIIGSYLDYQTYINLIYVDPENFNRTKLKKNLVDQTEESDLIYILRIYQEGLLTVRKNFPKLEGIIELTWVMKKCFDLYEEGVIEEIKLEYNTEQTEQTEQTE